MEIVVYDILDTKSKNEGGKVHKDFAKYWKS